MVLGLASMAFGANGDFFKVGKPNFASAVSTLSRSGAGPALSLKVGHGKSLAVNSSTKVLVKARPNSNNVGKVDSTKVGAASRADYSTCPAPPG